MLRINKTSLFIIVLLVLLFSCDLNTVEDTNLTEKAFSVNNGEYLCDTLKEAVQFLQGKSRSIDPSKAVRTYTIVLTKSIVDEGATFKGISGTVKIDLGANTYTLKSGSQGIVFSNTDKTIYVSNGKIQTEDESYLMDGINAVISISSDVCIDGITIDVSNSSVDAIYSSAGTLSIEGSTTIVSNNNKKSINAAGSAIVTLKSSAVVLTGGISIKDSSTLDLGEGTLYLTEDIEREGIDTVFNSSEASIVISGNVDSSKLEIAKHNHSWPETWETRTPVTEITDGLEFIQCSFCGEEKTRVLPKLGLSGIITDEHLHWTRENSPYKVVGNILVESGKTLVIDSGVVIQFEGEYYLITQGGFVEANGTSENHIIFLGVNAGENKWKGLRFSQNLQIDKSTSIPSYISGSKLEYVEIINCERGLEGCVWLENSVIDASVYALGYDRFKNNYKDTLLGSVIINSVVTGKCQFVPTTNCYLINSTFNGDIDIEANGSGECQSINIFGSTFDGLGKYQIYLNSAGFRTEYNNSLFKNFTEMETSNYSAFRSCSFDGIKQMNIYNSDFSYCTFNCIDNFLLKFKNSQVVFSNISNTSVSSYSYNSSQHIFRYNYWGDGTDELIRIGEQGNISFINDYYDDFTLPTIDYSRWVTVPFSNAGKIDFSLIYYAKEPTCTTYSSITKDEETNYRTGTINVTINSDDPFNKYRISDNLMELLSGDVEWIDIGESTDSLSIKFTPSSSRINESPTAMLKYDCFVQIMSVTGRESLIKMNTLYIN